VSTEHLVDLEILPGQADPHRPETMYFTKRKELAAFMKSIGFGKMDDEGIFRKDVSLDYFVAVDTFLRRGKATKVELSVHVGHREISRHLRDIRGSRPVDPEIDRNSSTFGYEASLNSAGRKLLGPNRTSFYIYYADVHFDMLKSDIISFVAYAEQRANDAGLVETFRESIANGGLEAAGPLAVFFTLHDREEEAEECFAMMRVCNADPLRHPMVSPPFPKLDEWRSEHASWAKSD
jgi:hypothetical protein